MSDDGKFQPTAEELEALKAEINKPQECHLCGSTKIYKYDGVGPLCKKCAYGGKARGIVPIKAEIKTGRNEPCPCGSGMKYKKCCINNSSPGL